MFSRIKQNFHSFFSCHRRGFTLVESLIYATIIVFVAIVAIGLILNILEGQAKSKSMYSVQENARLVMGRIVQEIHAAQDINTGSSDFDINLAEPINVGKKLSLQMRDSGLNPTEIDVSSYVARIKQGSGSVEEISSDNIKITKLVFTNLSSSNGRSKNIRVELTVEQPNPENLSYFDVVYSLTTSVEVRDRQ